MSVKSGEPDFAMHLRLRPDVRVYPYDDHGAVLKDPLTGNYLLLVEHEFTALRLMETSLKLSEWHERLLRAFPGSGVTRSDLKSFLLRLYRHQVLQSDATGITMNSASPRSYSLPLVLQKILGICFRIRIPIARPARLAEPLTRALRFAFSPAAVVCYCLMLLLAGAVIAVRFDDFRRDIPGLSMIFSPANLPWLLAMFVLVKVLHETGHIVACTHFGARVRDCGFLLLFFTPVLYTNVSDSWILPRRQRMIISAAGIIVELGLAAVFCLLWWVSANGSVRYLLMNGILLCTVSTLLFNGNPLLKFDGYFVLADLMRRPNLYQQSLIETQNFFATAWSESIRNAISAVTDRRYLIFGVLVCIYRVLLCIGFCSVAGMAVSGAGLGPMDLPIRLLLLSVLAVMPLTGFAQQAIRHSKESGLLPRMVFRTAIFVGLVWLVLSIPVRNSVCVSCVLIPEGSPVYADLTGRLTSFLPYGETVEAGREIALLVNDELQDQLLVAEADAREKQLRVESLRKLGLDLSAELLPTSVEASSAADRQLKLLNQQVAQLKITSPESGTLLPPEVTKDERHDRRMSRWHGTPLSTKNSGATMERGTLLGFVGQPGEYRVLAVLSEEQVEQIAAGQKAEMMSLSGDRSTVTTTIAELSMMSTDALPQCLLAQAENQWLLSKPGSVTNNVPVVSCLVTVDGDSSQQRLYSDGLLKVEGVSLSLGAHLSRFLRTTIFRRWM
jgi:putative peptide zinc metalloprotease protein